MDGMKPVPTETPNLASLLRTKPKVRHESFSQPTTPTSVDSGVGVSATDTVPADVVMPRAKASSVQAARSAERAVTPPRQIIAVYMPRSVHQAMAQAAKDNAVSQATFMLQAVNTHHRNLAQHLPGPPVGDLFAVPQARRKTEPVAQTSMRVTDQQLEALNRLADQLRANRSHVIVAALRAEFDL